MTSGSRESRFEELRRKARERLAEVRGNIEREMGTSAPKGETPMSDRFEDMFTSEEPARSSEVVSEPDATLRESNRGSDAWEQRVVVPAHTETTTPAFEASRLGPTISATPTTAASAVLDAQHRSSGRAHRSAAAQLLQKGNLRQAIIAQEVLGKPLSMRPSPNDET